MSLTTLADALTTIRRARVERLAAALRPVEVDPCEWFSLRGKMICVAPEHGHVIPEQEKVKKPVDALRTEAMQRKDEEDTISGALDRLPEGHRIKMPDGSAYSHGTIGGQNLWIHEDGQPALTPSDLLSQMGPDGVLPHTGPQALGLPSETPITGVDLAQVRMQSPEHAAASRYLDIMARRTGLTARVTPGIGDADAGQEPALLADVTGVTSFDQVKHAAAQHGRAYQQEAVIAFADAPDGPARIYSMDLPQDLLTVRAGLDAAGLTARTLIPKGPTTTQVVIFTPDDSQEEAVALFGGTHGVDAVSVRRGRGEHLTRDSYPDALTGWKPGEAGRSDQPGPGTHPDGTPAAADDTRHEVADAERDAADIAQRKLYDPDQPRHPAGSPEGGKWRDTGRGEGTGGGGGGQGAGPRATATATSPGTAAPRGAGDGRPGFGRGPGGRGAGRGRGEQPAPARGQAPPPVAEAPDSDEHPAITAARHRIIQRAEDEGSGLFPSERIRAIPAKGSIDLSQEEKDYLDSIANDPDVIRGRREAQATQTRDKFYDPATKRWSPEREALHQEILNELFNQNAVAKAGKRPRMVMFIGAPGSGKSSVLKPIVEASGDEFTTIDADKAKSRLPEYNGYNAAVVHEESAHIVEKRLLDAAREARHNILVDAVGKSADKYLALAKEYKKLGYDIEVYFADVTPLESAQRAMYRYRNPQKGELNRFVDPNYILSQVGSRPVLTYNQMKEAGFLTRAVRYDTSGPYGTPPRKLEDVEFDAYVLPDFTDPAHPKFREPQGQDRLSLGSSGLLGRSGAARPRDGARRVPRVADAQVSAGGLRDHTQKLSDLAAALEDLTPDPQVALMREVLGVLTESAAAMQAASKALADAQKPRRVIRDKSGRVERIVVDG